MTHSAFSIKRREDLERLVAELAVPVDLILLDQATTHRSYSYEHGNVPENERLEFLGDSVLGIVVTDHIFRLFPDLSEGQLAKLRAAVVNADACASVARALGVGPYMLLGRGEEITGGQDKASILADAMEAVLGAIYLSCGLDTSREFTLRHFGPIIEASSSLGAGLDWKTSLQEACALAGLGVPEYAVTNSGPDHAKEFEAQVLIAGESLGSGSGRTKKRAEQIAAQVAYEVLRQRTV